MSFLKPTVPSLRRTATCMMATDLTPDPSQGQASPRWTCLHVRSLAATRLLFEASRIWTAQRGTKIKWTFHSIRIKIRRSLDSFATFRRCCGEARSPHWHEGSFKHFIISHLFLQIFHYMSNLHPCLIPVALRNCKRGKKRARQTEEQSASLRGLVCLAAASLGVCPGASVAWRGGTRLCSHRWRRASSQPLPVSRIDCAGPSRLS